MIKKPEKQDVKARIMKAAEEEFLSVGYAGARMMVIAEKAGVTHAMLHYYFQSKKKLFEVIFRQKAGMFFGDFSVIMDAPVPFSDKIASLIEAHWQFVVKNSRIPLFLINEVTKNPDLLKNSIFNDIYSNPLGRFFHSFEKETKKAIRRKEIKPIDPLELLLIIFSINVFPVIIQPLLQTAGIIKEQDFRTMKRRSRNNSKFIIGAIKRS